MRLPASALGKTIASAIKPGAALRAQSGRVLASGSRFAVADLKGALHEIARDSATLKSVDRLLSQGFDLDKPIGTQVDKYQLPASLKEQANHTLLSYAAQAGAAKSIAGLHGRGAGVEARSLLGTPLLVALNNNQAEAARALLGAGASPLAFRHPLRVAVLNTPDVVPDLLKGGKIPLDKPDSEGRSPLFWSVVKNQPDTAKVLLEAKANPNIVDNSGLSLLDVARLNKNAAMEKQLKAYGARKVNPKLAAGNAAPFDLSHPRVALFNDELKALSKESFDKLYLEVFGDSKLKEWAGSIIGDWTGTYSDTQTAIRKAWEKVITRGKPTSPLERAIYDLVSTRSQRWKRLSHKTGIPVPESFHVYRGVQGPEFVAAVVSAWKDGTKGSMQVAHHTLSSWTMDPSVAKGFAGPTTGVMFEADIPFKLTLFDKWADDNNFSIYGENEVVVGTKSKNSLKIPKDQAVVLYEGKRYTYAERQTLISRWEKDHRANQD